MPTSTVDTSDYTNGVVAPQEGSIVVDTPDGIAFAQLLAFQGRFRLEVHNGLTSRVNTLQAYNANYGTNFKTRKKALKDCNHRIEEAKQQKVDQVVKTKTTEIAEEDYRGKLESMSVAQLRTVCRDGGLKGYSKLKKSDLVEIIFTAVRDEIEEALS